MRENTDLHCALSIIVPIYNAENTLVRCLDSILEQTYSDIEIICVDDESTDMSLRICSEYWNIDDRVKIVKKKNGGVASARNLGLKNARGKYVTFVDQDDWIEPDTYATMLSFAESYKADMVVCSYSKDSASAITKMENRASVQTVIESTEDLIKFAFFREEYRGFAAFVWNKIFRRDVLDEHKIKFDQTLKRGDDVLFYCEFATVAQKAIYIENCFYHYVQRDDSITHTRTVCNIERLEDILKGYERAINKLEDAQVGSESIDYMRCFYVYHASVLYELARENQMIELQEKYRIAMRKYFKEYKKQNQKDKERIFRIDELLK